MPINLEFKARLNSYENVKKVLNAIGAQQADVMFQKDTYFESKIGRLKLREINDNRSELIFYDRKESTDNRWSDYVIFNVDNPEILKSILAKSNRVMTTVSKKRELYLYKNSRIHIDKVENLGLFLEFEVLNNISKEDSKKLLAFLIEKFKDCLGEVFQNSYSDL